MERDERSIVFGIRNTWGGAKLMNLHHGELLPMGNGARANRPRPHRRLLIGLILVTAQLSGPAGPLRMGDAMRYAVLFASLIALFVSSGCDNQRDSAKGFRLPAGNAESGAAIYVAMSCESCHGIQVEGEGPAPADTKSIVLGGSSSNLPSDGYLVTAIINPSHVIKLQPGIDSTLPSGQSRMLDFNEVLSVRQLIDLVAYLQTLHEFRTVYEGHGLP
jgi:sulfur-oxidizing protein SoxX